ncbi:hypothetical protein [Kitasatospora sp. NBC_00458]|uniref:hypothetical protein n=1 Tax=Kitasatospora sp. NBC_00458 TaxID=2903568 RepID=UPI002E1864C7
MPYPQWRAGERITAARLASMIPAVVVKAAAQSVTNSTVLVDDTHLFLPVEANATYVLDGAVFYAGQYNAGDLRADWGIPGGAAMRWAINGAAPGGAAAYASNSTVVGTPLEAGTYGVGGALTSLHPVGHLVTASSGGLMRLRWAQRTAHATPTTLHPLSWLRLQRIA